MIEALFPDEHEYAMALAWAKCDANKDNWVGEFEVSAVLVTIWNYKQIWTV